MNDRTVIAEIQQKLRRLYPQLRDGYHVERLQLFGSYVRGEEKAGSDLDILVTFSETPSLLEFIALENDLSDTLGIKVDLVMSQALKEPLQHIILEEAIPV